MSAAKVEQSSSFETPHWARESSEFSLGRMLPVAGVDYRRSQQLAGERGRQKRIAGKSKWKTCYAARGIARREEFQASVGFGQGGAGQGRLSIGGRVKLATTWRSWPISVQQSELVGACKPEAALGRGRGEEEPRRSCCCCCFAYLQYA